MLTRQEPGSEEGSFISDGVGLQGCHSGSCSRSDFAGRRFRWYVRGRDWGPDHVQCLGSQVSGKSWRTATLNGPQTISYSPPASSQSGSTTDSSSRLWTLQEAAYVERVHFQFADAVHTYRDLSKHLKARWMIPNINYDLPRGHVFIQELEQRNLLDERLQTQSHKVMHPFWPPIAQVCSKTISSSNEQRARAYSYISSSKRCRSTAIGTIARI